MAKTLVFAPMLFGCLLHAGLTHADDREAIESLLKSQVIDAQLPQAQVEAFCEARVPTIPNVNSLEEWEQFANKWRAEMFDQVIFRGAAAEWRKASLRVEWLD